VVVGVVEKKGAMAKLLPETCEGEMITNFIPSKRAGETHYLCGEKATYIGSGTKSKETKWKARENK